MWKGEGGQSAAVVRRVPRMLLLSQECKFFGGGGGGGGASCGCGTLLRCIMSLSPRRAKNLGQARRFPANRPRGPFSPPAERLVCGVTPRIRRGHGTHAQNTRFPVLHVGDALKMCARALSFVDCVAFRRMVS